MSQNISLIHIFEEESDKLLARLLERISAQNCWDYSTCLLGQSTFGDNGQRKNLFVIDLLTHPHRIELFRKTLSESAVHGRSMALVVLPLWYVAAMAKAPMYGIDYCFLTFENLDEIYLRINLIASDLQSVTA